MLCLRLVCFEGWVTVGGVWGLFAVVVVLDFGFIFG